VLSKTGFVFSPRSSGWIPRGIPQCRGDAKHVEHGNLQQAAGFEATAASSKCYGSRLPKDIISSIASSSSSPSLKEDRHYLLEIGTRLDLDL
jgi:hypothetical protein